MQHILLIDNNDSFTFNIVDYLRRMKGVCFKVINSRKLKIHQVKSFDKIIISPGPGLPEDYPILDEVYKHFIGQKALLGICLGHQALGLHFGANLKQLSPVVHGQAHAIKVIKQVPIFKDIPQALQVGLYHSWAIDEKTLSDDLEVIAWSEHDIIMAIKHKEYPVFGVQFHPESFITEHGFTILENFIGL